MKKMRQILAVLLALAMTLGLAACGGSKDDGKGQSQTENGGGEEEPYEVVIEIMGSGVPQADMAMVEEAINELTVPAINCTVKFRDIAIADHATQMGLLGSDNEKLDIIFVGYTTSMANLKANGLLLGLGDLLEEYAPEMLEKAGVLMEACYVDDDYYCVPGNYYPAIQTGVAVDKQIFEEYNIEVPENPENSYEYINKLYENVRNSDFDGYAFSSGDGVGVNIVGHNIEKFGAAMSGDSIYGVLMDMHEDTEIVNIFDTPEYLEECLQRREWNLNGSMVPDSLTSGTTQVDDARAGKICAGVNPLTANYINNNVKITGREMEAYPIGDLYLSGSSIPEYGLGVTVTSERPEKAVQLLNMIMTNPELANIMNYGIEGVHYEKVSEHIIDYPEGTDPMSLGWGMQIVTYGDSAEIYQRAPYTEDWYEEVKAYSADKAQISKAFGYAFDPENVKTQVAAVTSVVGEYHPSLCCGVVEDVEGRVEEFRAALKAAGIDEIIAENQRQFDEWLATK